MTANNTFGILRKVLRALGLSQQAADDVVHFLLCDSKTMRRLVCPKILTPA